MNDIGYDGIELCYGGGDYGFYQKSASELQDALEKSDLVAFSSHVKYRKLKDDLTQIAKYLKSVGCETLVTGPPEELLGDRDTINQIVEELINLGKKVNDHGLNFALHLVSSIVGGNPWNSTRLEIFLDEIGGELLVQPDVGNLEMAGIGNATDFFEGPDVSFASIHLKDAIRGKTGSLRLGEGDADLKGFVELGRDRDVEWFVVEDYSGDDPMKDVKYDFDYLSSL